MRRFRKPITEEERTVKDPDKARQKTFDRAVNLLTFKPRSEAELRERLLEKSWTNDEIVDDVIGKLKEYNYINDSEYAASLAASKLRQKPVGRHRLRQDLNRKKLDKQVIEQALDAAFEEYPEEVLIESALEKRLRIKGRPETRADQKKLFDHLMRLGFDYDLIREKIESMRVDH
jgi:regulatory protein